MIHLKPGTQYNRLTALEFVKRDRHSDPYWRWQCVCGNTKVIRLNSVRHGHTKSCGCLHKESAAFYGKANKTHGDHKSPEYTSWAGAKNRCRCVRNKDYASYGGRGIAFSTRWDSYEVFLSDMGRRPGSGFSLERSDVNGPYSKENCKWATPTEQNGNRRTVTAAEVELQYLRKRLKLYEECYGIL